jgi:iron-sulfur cluster repair protein YtfE (RIC family)
MTEQLSVALEREHRLIDDGIEAFAVSRTDPATAEQRAALIGAVALLRRHIYFEEEFLFPALREAGLAGPVMVMVHEHGQMWPILGRLEQVLITEPTETASLLCQDLLRRLAEHNMKEERILYPQADLTVPNLPPAADLADVLATTQAPAGWVSQGATTA